MDIKKIPFLIICLSLVSVSCKKDVNIDALTNIVIPKSGTIHIECADCTITYSILTDNYTVSVLNSKDIPFTYVSDFKLKTAVSAKTKQNIRLAVFDSYGRQVSNELELYAPGVSKMDSFDIKLD
jgi:hypothetical protein